MPDIEFLPNGDENRSEVPRASVRDRRRLAVRALGAAAVLTAAVVAVVVRNGGQPAPKARPAAAPTRAATRAATSAPTKQISPLALPVSVAFGSASVDVLAVGDRIYSLTPTLIAMAGRDLGAAVVRPAPLGLSELAGHGELIADVDHHLLWVVDIGGHAIGAYGMDHLEPLSTPLSRYRINGAVAMDEQLWFTTDHGLYTAVAGPGAPRLMRHTRHSLGPIVTDPALHRVLVVERTSPARLLAVTTLGGVADFSLPISDVSSMANLAGKLWLAGRSAPGPQLLVVDPAALRAHGNSTVSAQVGSRPRIVGTFQNLLLVRTDPGARSLYCLDGSSGVIKQIWNLPLGAVTLNQTGLLVDAASGIQQLDAHACLAG